MSDPLKSLEELLDAADRVGVATDAVARMRALLAEAKAGSGMSRTLLLLHPDVTHITRELALLNEQLRPKKKARKHE
jgi:hypothetical protein